MASVMTKSPSTSTDTAISGVNTSAKSNFEFEHQPQDEDVKQLKSASPFTEQTTPILPSKSSITKNSDCYFLDRLPREMRNAIYEHLLVFSGDVVIEDGRLRDFTTKDEWICRHFDRPALLATCTQVRDEATELFFGRNTFVVPVEIRRSSISSLSCWLRRLGSLEKKCIRSLHVILEPHWYQKHELWRKIRCLVMQGPGPWDPEDEDVLDAFERTEIFNVSAKELDQFAVQTWFCLLKSIRGFDLRKIVVKAEQDNTWFAKITEAWAQDFGECLAAVVDGRKPRLRWVR